MFLSPPSALAGRRAAAGDVAAASRRVEAAAAAASADSPGLWAAAWAEAQAAAAAAAACPPELALAAATARNASSVFHPGRILLVSLDPPSSRATPAVLLRVAPDAKQPGGKAYVVAVAPWVGGAPSGGADAAAPPPPADAAAASPAPMRVVSRKSDGDDAMYALSSGKGSSSARGGGGASLLAASSPSTPDGGRLPAGLPCVVDAAGGRVGVLALPCSSIVAATAARLTPSQSADAGPLADAKSPPAAAKLAASLAASLATDFGSVFSAADRGQKGLRMEDIDACSAYDALASSIASLRMASSHLSAITSAESAPPRRVSELRALAAARCALRARLATETAAESDAALERMPDYVRRVSVLRSLGYLDGPPPGSVTLKGRVACEVNTADELTLSEMIFGGIVSPLTPAEAAALLSGLVLQERSAAPPQDVTPALAAAMAASLATARRVGEAQAAAGLAIDPDEFASSVLRFGLAEAVHAWASGAPFLEVAMLTDVAEGTIVRTIVRLHETLRELRNAARLCGDAQLSALADAAAAAVKRDIVFSASLYTAGGG